jgi:hypothetical protein
MKPDLRPALLAALCLGVLVAGGAWRLRYLIDQELPPPTKLPLPIQLPAGHEVIRRQSPCKEWDMLRCTIHGDTTVDISAPGSADVALAQLRRSIERQGITWTPDADRAGRAALRANGPNVFVTATVEPPRSDGDKAEYRLILVGYMP